MAFWSRNGKSIVPRLLPRWGVRGSLFAAFTVIAGMAIVISAGAGLVLGHLGGAMASLSGQTIPGLVASLGLSAQGAALAAQGPGLLASPSEDALNERARKMKDTQQGTAQKLAEISDLGADPAVVAALRETVKNIDEATQSLASAARERLTLAAEHDKQYEGLRAAQTAFAAAGAPVMMDAQTRINAILGSASLSADDANDAAQTVLQLSNVIASGNLAAADLIAGLSANNSDQLDDIQKEFKQAAGRVRSNLDLLPDNQGAKSLRGVAEKLLAFGTGKSGVFNLRQKELDGFDYGQTVLDETRKLNVGLDIGVQQLVDAVRKSTDAATAAARQEISAATMAMLGLGVLTLIGSALFVWRYVGANILKRIGGLQRSMQRLSSGDLETDIVGSKQRDEIAAMADALEVFRDSMIRARALAAAQDEDRVAKNERASRIEAKIAEFEATVRSALGNLQGSANSMQ
ncbi:HAMP domain-containing protein, partial [Bradyrhizobium sp.]|uniref:HAMP domain-containing protein n=1 Tax=Bradyrhizobium sp. TaxID=376 RepID=UPI001EB2CFBD